MSNRDRFPRINIRSKNELAKHIADKSHPYQERLVLINDAINNFNDYWYDSSRSEIEKEKFVRSAIGTPLGKLLKLLNDKVLAPFDCLIPEFIFGGISGKDKNHIRADYKLLGKKRDRILLGLDIFRFFEQIREERVVSFYKKCGCSLKAAKLLAYLSCVNFGKKGSLSKHKTLARGFATSSRLAIWCNLNTFIRVDWKVKKLLRGHDPRLAIFVDDIGISASDVSREKIEEVSKAIEAILTEFDPNQKLPVSEEKKKIRLFNENAEHLGLKLGRNKLSMGRKTKSRIDKVSNDIKNAKTESEKNQLLNKKKSYFRYQRQIAISNIET